MSDKYVLVTSLEIITAIDIYIVTLCMLLKIVTICQTDIKYRKQNWLSLRLHMEEINHVSDWPCFVNRDREISPCGPGNDIKTGNFMSHCCDQGGKWILFSPTNVTGAGPYLVRGLSKVLGTGILLQWSCEWE